MITVEIMKHAAKYMIPWPKIQTILPKFPSQMARSPCPLGMKSSWVKLFTRKLAPRHLGGKFIMKSRKNLKSLSSQNFPELFGTFEKPLLDCFAEERLSTTSTGDTLNTATDSKKALLFGLCCQCRRCTICEWNKWNKWNKWNIFRVVEHCIVQKHEISCHASSHETLPAVAMGKAPHRRKAARPAQPVPPASSSGFFGRSDTIVFWSVETQENNVLFHSSQRFHFYLDVFLVLKSSRVETKQTLRFVDPPAPAWITTTSPWTTRPKSIAAARVLCCRVSTSFTYSFAQVHQISSKKVSRYVNYTLYTCFLQE